MSQPSSASASACSNPDNAGNRQAFCAQYCMKCVGCKKHASSLAACSPVGLMCHGCMAPKQQPAAAPAPSFAATATAASVCNNPNNVGQRTDHCLQYCMICDDCKAHVPSVVAYSPIGMLCRGCAEARDKTGSNHCSRNCGPLCRPCKGCGGHNLPTVPTTPARGVLCVGCLAIALSKGELAIVDAPKQLAEAKEMQELYYSAEGRIQNLHSALENAGHRLTADTLGDALVDLKELSDMLTGLVNQWYKASSSSAPEKTDTMRNIPVAAAQPKVTEPVSDAERYMDENTTKEERAAIMAAHPPTDACPDPECVLCSMRDCPAGCELHYDKDGCPDCHKK